MISFGRKDYRNKRNNRVSWLNKLNHASPPKRLSKINILHKQKSMRSRINRVTLSKPKHIRISLWLHIFYCNVNKIVFKLET